MDQKEAVGDPVKKILVFEPQTGGHRANFIRWLADAAGSFPEIRLIFFTAEEVSCAAAARLAAANGLKKQWILYRLFRAACRETQPDHVLVPELTQLELPLLLFGSPVPVSAILFVQYPELPSGLKRFLKHGKTALLLRRAPVRNLFLLNGEKSCGFLEKRFSSFARFIPVPDPAAPAESDPEFVLRDTYRISPPRKVFLFFGAISRRKGADVLIKALHRLSEEAAGKSAFLFCGAAEPGYQKPFERACDRLRALRPDIRMNVDLRFMSDGEMMALFEQSDVILMPYVRPEYSSGILALAARAGKPVIGPDCGLLGRLIRENGLGAACAIRPDVVARSIEAATASSPPADPVLRSLFEQKSSPEEFSRRVLDAMDHER